MLALAAVRDAAPAWDFDCPSAPSAVASAVCFVGTSLEGGLGGMRAPTPDLALLLA